MVAVAVAYVLALSMYLLVLNSSCSAVVWLVGGSESSSFEPRAAGFGKTSIPL